MKIKSAKRRSAIFILMFLMLAFPAGKKCFARDVITDWYIKDFDSQIVVNKDSSLDITERIIADCGNLPEKHGIYRVLPENVNITSGGSIKTPVELGRITDFNGNNIKYTESRSHSDHTVTWKIGDPNKTVKGENSYMIHYRVKNAIRSGNSDFDELYWNLNGNFWTIETDNFHARIIFPSGITNENSTVDYYTGNLGGKGKEFASYKWDSPNVIEFDSAKTLGAGQGITASITFPKNIIASYQPSFWEKYWLYFFPVTPIIVFSICFYLWSKHGKDPRVDKTVIPEYDVPGNLSPIELGMLKNNGSFDNNFITAEMINLATKKLISIKEIRSKILFFDMKDYKLTKNPNIEAENSLNAAQKAILRNIFDDGDEIDLSSLKNSFYKAVKDIQNKAKKILEDKKLIAASGLRLRTGFTVSGIMLIFLTFFVGALSGFITFTFLISGIIVLVFSFIMPKRTPAGAELNWQIKGFKLFMETVDKDRAKFYEKENIFEKFLPYAIVFGMTKQWINRMKEIYGEEYFNNYAPVWYAGNAAAFNADSFNSAISSLSSSIASNTSAPSGSGGGGGAGGGGGGGGGGGW
jgi:hypothetical protein